MGRRRRGSLAGSPLLIGAVTTLIAVVAVFLSYNANNGLPFVPTYNIKVVLPEAAGLQPSNQVRIAGSRVGVINSMSAHQDPATGRVVAIANLKLEKKYEPLPIDTRAIVQSVSAIGLKYLELEKGSSPVGIKPDHAIPITQTSEPVDIDQFFNMFDEKTRTASQQNLNAFGDGLAGRGLGLNNTIATLRPLVTRAIPVLHNLASPQTDLHGFWVGLERPTSQAAPVAQANANSFSYQDTFFKAWASVAPSLERAIVLGPPSLEQAIHSLPFQAKFTENSAEFMRLLRPSAEALVTASLEDFTQTLQFANPIVAGLAPAQAFCNYLTLTFRNIASLLSENIGVGTLARAGLVLAPSGPNNEGYPSSAPANGPSVEKAFVGSNVIVNNNHVHSNPYPNVAGPGQPKLCEAGNETYEIGKTITTNLPPSSVGKNRELTSREQNLFGERYPSSTLRDLGLSKGKGR